MSIALERNSNNRIMEGSTSGFIRGMSCKSGFESADPGRSSTSSIGGIMPAGDRKFPARKAIKVEVDEQEEVEEDQLVGSSSSSSSIGRNSDCSERSSDDDDGSGETEVQSSYKGPFDSMDSLEDVLPIRKGISKFYCGKSKSFTSLAEATDASSIRDIAKPDNAYSKKRRNLLACSIILDKNRNYPLRGNGGGISKRTLSSSRSTLALGVAMSSSENTSENSGSPPRTRPPLHPQVKRSVNNGSTSPPPQRNLSSWRSFSLADLQCAANASSSMTTSTTLLDNNIDKNKKLH